MGKEKTESKEEASKAPIRKENKLLFCPFYDLLDYICRISKLLLTQQPLCQIV